ncbi:MAG: C69 family dipeptidase, partial [Thermoguttaceae bacterium]
MKKTKLFLPLLLVVATVIFCECYQACACTNLLVTKGASVDGSVMITYTADSAGFYAKLELFPATDHKPGTEIVIPATEHRPEGK